MRDPRWRPGLPLALPQLLVLGSLVLVKQAVSLGTRQPGSDATLAQLDQTLLIIVGGHGRTAFANAAEEVWARSFAHRLYVTDTNETASLVPTLRGRTINVYPEGCSVNQKWTCRLLTA
jgi:hypothetical protein